MKHVKELTTFDYSEYVSACMSLSIFWYLWKPEGQNELRMDRYVPLSQSKKKQKQLAALFSWANRTDPGSVIRDANMKREWLATQPVPT
jgi:hypothetical protein